MNTRRQTLGAVHVDHGNRRKSVGPSRSGIPTNDVKKARPNRSRASMIPRVGRENNVPPTPPSVTTKPNATSSSSRRRRSSVAGGLKPAAPHTARTDPRPLSDKAFQQDCIRRLLSFLVERGYEHPISHKSLARPSGKDFNNIVIFMIRIVDPNFQDGSLRLEDEIVMILKAMGYPFPVSKTALVAAGSPHTWPSLLAALTWLMERIKCMDTIDDEEESEDFKSLEELEIKTDKAFFKYLGAAYNAFLRGDELMTEQLQNKLADRFERDDAKIEMEIEQMTDKNALFVERINSLSVGKEDLQEYSKKRDSYSTDLEQFQDLIQQMNQHVAALAKKKKDKTNELEETNRKLARSTAQLDKLKSNIKSQPISVDDVAKIQNEIKGVKEAIDRATTLKNTRRDALWQSNATVEEVWNEIEGSSSEYNSQLSDILLLPSISKTTLEMKTKPDRTTFLEVDLAKHLGVDSQEDIENQLLDWKNDFVEKLSESKKNQQEQLYELERSEEAFTDALEELKIIENKIDNFESTITAEREVQEAKLSVRVREAESMEKKVTSLRDPVVLEEQMAQFESQCTELESLRLKHEQDNMSRKKIVCGDILRACSALKKHDEFWLQKVTELQSYKRAKANVNLKLQVPENLNVDISKRV